MKKPSAQVLWNSLRNQEHKPGEVASKADTAIGKGHQMVLLCAGWSGNIGIQRQPCIKGSTNMDWCSLSLLGILYVRDRTGVTSNKDQVPCWKRLIYWCSTLERCTSIKKLSDLDILWHLVEHHLISLKKTQKFSSVDLVLCIEHHGSKKNKIHINKKHRYSASVCKL